MTERRIDVSFRPEGTDISVSFARAHLPGLLERVLEGEAIYLSRYGKRVAALVPAGAAEYLDEVEDKYWAKRGQEALERDDFVPWDQVVAELESNDAR